MVVTGAAERVPDRLRCVVYVDAFVPQDGESLFDLLPPEWTSMLRASAIDGVVPVPFSFEETASTHGAWYAERTVGQPLGTFEQAAQLSGGSPTIPRAYIRCLESDVPVEPCAERARAAGWAYRELAAGHDAQVEDPAGLTDLLTAIV